jgi:hypothetical protein
MSITLEQHSVITISFNMQAVYLKSSRKTTYRISIIISLMMPFSDTILQTNNTTIPFNGSVILPETLPSIAVILCSIHN